MTDNASELTNLQQLEQTRREIEVGLVNAFAHEDEGLKQSLQLAKKAGLPEIQISPLQGKLLQFLATTCNAHKILEIGSLAGYSGIWLARALPENGRLITLEVNQEHANVVRSSFAAAGVQDRTEVRVGNALETLPTLEAEAPFDLVFIDADKTPYPEYLEWALRLTRPGSIIVADNCIRGGAGLNFSDHTGVAEYNRRIASNPRLVSLALVMDDSYTDGFAISVVKPS